METWVQIPSTCKMCTKSVRCGMHLNLSEDRQILGICCLATLDCQWPWYPVSKNKVERNRGRHPTDADLCSTQRVTHTQHVQMCTHSIYCKGQETDSQAAAGLTAICLFVDYFYISNAELNSCNRVCIAAESKLCTTWRYKKDCQSLFHWMWEVRLHGTVVKNELGNLGSAPRTYIKN